MLFNYTRDPVVLCNESDLRYKILEALELAKKVVCKREKIPNLNYKYGMREKARNGSTKFSLFKYLDKFEEEFHLDQKWLKKLYQLTDLDPKDSRYKFHQLLPKYTEDIPITLNDARGLRADLKLLLHCCWASKFLLLPVYFSDIPKIKHGKSGRPLEYAKDAYPEIFKIIRAPFFNELECDVDISQFMAESSMKNFGWYAHRYVRACAAWKVEDITNELLEELANHRVQGVPRTVDWYLGLHACLPRRVRFDIDKVYAHNCRIPGTKGKLTVADFTSIELKKHPAIPVWIEEVNDYIEALKDKGVKTYVKYQSVIRRALHILIVSGEDLPEPKDIKRKQAKIIISKLGKDLKQNSRRSLLVMLERFFDYLVTAHKDFNKPLNRDVDFPISKRSKSTVKELFPEDTFAPYLSYLYGMAEWVWYMNHHNPNRDGFILGLSQYDKTISTSDTGFTPIFRYEGKYHPIEEIPRKIFPSFRPRVNQLCQLKSCTFIPHYIHLSIVMAETGIRLMALRWLDALTYDQNVDRDFFGERSYLPTKLWVNTDKSHDAWEANVSETVIGILDRQSAWKKAFLNGDDLPIYYDGHELSEFDTLKPLFAQVDPHLQIKDSFSVVTDPTYRIAFKHSLMHFSYIYSNLDKHNVPPVDIHHNKDLASNLERIKNLKGNEKIVITPHTMRAQVVSNNITILPTSVIKKSTGHVDNAHVIYYAKISSKYLNAQKASQEEEFKDFIGPMMVDTRSKKSALRQALSEDVNGTLNDFGAVSFSDHGSRETRSGMLIIREKLDELVCETNGAANITDQLAFNSTHICPFNNKCPSTITKNAFGGLLRCGECPYSIKTVDHLPAIGAKIRSFTDKAAELEVILNEAKTNGTDMSSYINEVTLKQFYCGEISAWATTATCLDMMVKSLSKKDKWLVREPDFIREKLTKLKSTNELTNTLVRIEEAISSKEFLTSKLEAKVALFRTKILAQTGQFKALLKDSPTDQTLLTEFKGIIKTICDISGIGINDLPEELERIEVDVQKTLGDTLLLPTARIGVTHA